MREKTFAPAKIVSDWTLAISSHTRLVKIASCHFFDLTLNVAGEKVTWLFQQAVQRLLIGYAT